MAFKKIALLFALLWIAACSDGESDEKTFMPLIEDDEESSSIALNGSIEYMPSMNAERVRIFQVDRDLNPIDSFEVTVGPKRGHSIEFAVDARYYETPYLKLVTIFPLNKKEKMELSQYYYLDTYNTHVYLQFYGALISGRVETLVREKKYSLHNAINKAYEELEKSMGISLEDPQYRTFNEGNDYYSNTGLFDMTPYVLCRYEISDSLFYSDFREWRDFFAKDGKFDSTIKVRAADSWLATFDLRLDSRDKFYFESDNRDTSSRLKKIDTAFFAWAYELDRSWSEKDSIEIMNELSLYNGRQFVYERNCPSLYGWRLQTTLEDTIGTCLCNRWDFVEHDGIYYLCRYESGTGWEVLSDVDSILNHKYSEECNRGIWSYGVLGYHEDKTYVCDCDDSDQCGWSEVKEDFKWTVLDTPTVNILAARLYGDCRDHGGEKQVMDSILLRCHWNRWAKVDTLSYYMGICHNTSNQIEFGQMPNGDYYKCRTYGGTEWEPCTYPEVKGDLCNWVIDPVYKKYGDQYFYCSNEKWSEVPEDSVYKPVVCGDSCGPVNKGEIKKYDDEYFICNLITTSGRQLYYWQRASESDLSRED